MLKKPIVLPILFHNSEENTSVLEDSGIDVPFENYLIKKTSFYTINAVTYNDTTFPGKKLTAVYTVGESFICALPHKEVLEIIDKHLNS